MIVLVSAKFRPAALSLVCSAVFAVCSNAQQTTIIGVDFPVTQIDVSPNFLIKSDTNFTGINDANVVVGTLTLVVSSTKPGPDYNSALAQTLRRAFIYTDGKFSLVPDPLPSLRDTSAIAINNRGQILLSVGYPAPQVFFVYDMQAKSSRFISPYAAVVVQGNSIPITLTGFTGLNDKGEVVGYVQGGVGAYGKPVLGEPGVLYAPPNVASFNMAAYPCNPIQKTGGINNKDEIVGTCGSKAFIARPDGTLLTFSLPNPKILDNGLPRLRQLINGLGINDAGVVVGASAEPSQKVGFIYRGGQCVEFPDANLWSINNRGLAVGFKGARNVSGVVTTLKP